MLQSRLLLPLLGLLASHIRGTPIGLTEDDILSIESATKALSDLVDLEPRQWVNCEDEKANFDASCWDTLKLTDWLTGWNAYTPICTDDRSDPRMDGSGCCRQDEGWARCFLRLARGTNDQDCTVINDQKCASDIEVDPSLPKDIMPQVRYIQKNIHEINNFFSNYFQGMIAIL